jgi:hypothetical protein
MTRQLFFVIERPQRDARDYQERAEKKGKHEAKPRQMVDQLFVKDNSEH